MSTFVKIAAVALAGATMVAADASCTSLADAITENGLTRLGAAVAAVSEVEGAATLGLLATSPFELPESDKVTIFAPADEAWPADEDTPTDAALLGVLFGHVVPLYLPSAGAVEALTGAGGKAPLPTVAGTNLTASLVGEDIYVAAPMQSAPGAKVIAVDVETCVGVVHVIDALLIEDAEGMAPAPAPIMAPAIAPAGKDDVEGTDMEGEKVTEGKEVTEGSGTSNMAVGGVVTALAAVALLV